MVERNRLTTSLIKEFLQRDVHGEGYQTSIPRLTIVTTSFNQAEFVERTIRSVLNQGYPNLEYIVIDGGSADGSVDIISRFADHLAHWRSEPDKGQSDGLNKGFRMASGDVIGWQNSDDIYLPNAFQTAMAHFASHPKTDIFFGNRLDIDRDDNIIGEGRFTRWSVTTHWYEGMALSNQSTFWRRRVFDTIGLLDENLHAAMDYEFFLRAGLNRLKFARTSRYLGAIRRHEMTKQSTMWSSTMAKDHIEIDKQYGKRGSLQAAILGSYSRLRRGILYVAQGDFDYALRGLRRRVRSGLRG